MDHPQIGIGRAALLARLLNHVTCNLRGTINLDETVYAWTDSRIVLCWLQTSVHTLEVFVANRVSQITGSETPLVWRHVPGEWNPADCASRGCRAPDLVSHPLWWGPQWLTESPQEWPFNECRAPLGPPDRGWIKRFVNNCRKPQAERNFTPVLSPAERNAALCSLVRVVQAEHFEEEAPKGSLLIDSSTVDPNVPKQIHPVATEKGVGFIDAPVSGGVMGAQNATLAFMSGGNKSDFDRSLPVLGAMGAKLFHCGVIGSGQVAKLANNMLMGITGMATAECMNMGIKAGLDPKVLLDVLNNSSARSWSTEVYCPVPGLVPTAPSSRDYENGFKNELMVKDLELASGLALNIRSPIPLGAVATQLYRIVQSRGYGQKDFSYVFQLLKEEADKNKS
ncbi:NAD-binding of NADP-dependent 3-hydroxyisobutyrate dehydrogenase domain-containing protein [Phthorimaea operculella]|nr:NAD-binding of NADP-dependent 3-hydroxyisobutyrate dehydrogenase domain-containing protein [Phthorimaea operculella]